MTIGDAAELELRRRAKRELRRRLEGLRVAVPPRARAERSRALVEGLLGLPVLARARAVALFSPLEPRGEVDLRPLHAALRARGVACAYPFGGLRGKERGFALVEEPGALVERGHGYPEPPPGAARLGRGDLDVVVVPALAAAPDGHRLGYGAGFYDAVLPEFRPPAVAVAVVFDFLLLPELPMTPGDVAVDLVVTDLRVVTVDAAAGQPEPASRPG